MSNLIRMNTDIVVDAARITASIYKNNLTKLAARGHSDTALVEAKRAALMEELAKDDNLCEMFSGRLSQIGNPIGVQETE